METKAYAAGEKSRSICSVCKKLVRTTFAYRDVTVGEGRVVNTLVAVCDECANVVAIPASSIPLTPY